jgi:hypothetical protein
MGGKSAGEGEGQRADGGDAGIVGQRRGGGAILVYIEISAILYLFSTDCLSFFRPSVTDFLQF